MGVIEPGPPDATSTVVVIGGDADWIARYLAGLPFPFEVLDSDEVRRSRSSPTASWGRPRRRLAVRR